MIVGPTQQTVLKDGRHRTKVRATFSDGTERDLKFETSADIPFLETNVGDIWLPTMLVLAMRRGEEHLELTDAISDRAPAIARAQDILTTWYPRRMHRVEVHAPPAETPRRRPWRRDPPKVTGTCFTGGVDSFYSLTKNKARVGAIVYGFGLDVPLGQSEAVERTTAQLEDVAAESGIRLLTTRTTIRTFLGKDTRWGSEAHGAALASLATVFSPVLDRILVPATHDYRASFPWGSHPLLDDLWSTDRLAVEHDGAEAGRMAKTRLIADDPVAQRHLRVCYMQFATTNCCRCHKCMRTMASLQALDRLDRFPTFHEPLDLELFGAHQLRQGNGVTQVRDLYRYVARLPEHQDIAAACARMLERAGAL